MAIDFSFYIIPQISPQFPIYEGLSHISQQLKTIIELAPFFSLIHSFILR